MRRTAITTPFAQARRPSSLASIVVVVSRTLACAQRAFSLSLGAIVIVVSRLPSHTLQDGIDVVFGWRNWDPSPNNLGGFECDCRGKVINGLDPAISLTDGYDASMSFRAQTLVVHKNAEVLPRAHHCAQERRGPYARILVHKNSHFSWASCEREETIETELWRTRMWPQYCLMTDWRQWERESWSGWGRWSLVKKRPRKGATTTHCAMAPKWSRHLCSSEVRIGPELIPLRRFWKGLVNEMLLLLLLEGKRMKEEMVSFLLRTRRGRSLLLCRRRSRQLWLIWRESQFEKNGLLWFLRLWIILQRRTVWKRKWGMTMRRCEKLGFPTLTSLPLQVRRSRRGPMAGLGPREYHLSKRLNGMRKDWGLLILKPNLLLTLSFQLLLLLMKRIHLLTRKRICSRRQGSWWRVWVVQMTLRRRTSLLRREQLKRLQLRLKLQPAGRNGYYFGLQVCSKSLGYSSFCILAWSCGWKGNYSERSNVPIHVLEVSRLIKSQEMSVQEFPTML